MKFQKKFLIIFIVTVLLFIISREYIAFRYQIDDMQKKLFVQNKTNLDVVLNLQKRSVEAMAMQLANDAQVIRGYQEDDPNILIDHLNTFWEKVRENGLIYEIHFFKPPAISFVNFSNFKSIGKDVSDVRSDIAWVTSSFSSSSHVMMCKTYAGIRATYPIADPGTKEVLGGLSLGKKVDWIPSTMKKLVKKESFLLYSQTSAQRLAPKYYERFMQDKQAFEGLILAESTIDIDTDEIKNISMDAKHQKVYLKGKEYHLNIYPLRDFDDKTMAYVAVLDDFSPLYVELYNRLGLHLSIILALSLIAYWIVRFNINAVIDRIHLIRELTLSFKAKSFQVLNDKELQKLTSKEGDEIHELHKDVVDMGGELSRYYNDLEAEVDKKTVALTRLNRELEKSLYTDGVTGMPNRYALAEALKKSHAVSVAVANINNFKNVNDLYGIENGNILLISVAHAIQEIAAQLGIEKVYSLGADETALLIPSTGKAELERVAYSLVEQVENRVFELKERHIELSINIAVGISIDSKYMLEQADMALQEAKRRQVSVVIYSDEHNMLNLYKENQKLLQQLRFALQNDQIITYYQPIVDREKKVVKYESLVRMVSEGKVLSPYHFLEFSKQTKYYHMITAEVINRTFACFENRTEMFSVNLTLSDIISDETRTLVLEKIQKEAFRGRVIIELVESESVQNIDVVDGFVKKVKEHGGMIAIDDFGSGYSNFSYLLEMKPDYIKIDGSLIKNIHESQSSLAIVKTIISFAKELGIRTIAEFVHSEEVFDLTYELGVDEFQGYYFYEPSESLVEGLSS